MTLEETIQQDLMSAMKNKEEIRLSTLRAVKTAIMEKRTSANFKGDITDSDVTKIMQKMAKEREEVAKVYSDNGRPELAQKEISEAEIIKEYLPKSMSAEEVENVVKEIITEIGATSMKDMGRVMKASMAKLAGQTDGSVISNAVKSLLS